MLMDETSERMDVGYYMYTVKDNDLYEKLCKKYEFYTTEEKINQYKHEFDTKINEGMNTCVAKYSPKNKHYSKSISLEARVKTILEI